MPILLIFTNVVNADGFIYHFKILSNLTDLTKKTLEVYINYAYSWKQCDFCTFII